MRKLQIRSIFILLTLLIGSTFLIAFSSLPVVMCGPDIPEENERNGWHWSIDIGDHLYFEVEIIAINQTSSETFMMFKDLWIYNITSIENVTIDWLGEHEFSRVNAAHCFYNLTSEALEAYGAPDEFAIFGYNASDAITYRYRAGLSGIGYVLPLNSTENVNVTLMADILNESLYFPMSQDLFNVFDHYESDPIDNRIYFANTTDEYFIDVYYYDDGTLKSGAVHYLVNIPGDPMVVNATIKRVFDYNITDEVEWGVEVGDELYYDFYDGNTWIDDSSEIKVVITGFSDEMLEKTKNSFWYDPIYMIFQVVYADLYFWNGTDYELTDYDVEIGFANNFYPQYFEGAGPQLWFLYPSNTAMEDLLFMYNNDTIRIWELPFEEISYSENDYLEVILRSSTINTFVRLHVDQSTGIIISFLNKFDDDIIYFEVKTQTLVDWSVDYGDIIYYKMNADIFEDHRYTIRERYTVFVNMTMLEIELNSYGVPITVPTSQPELQFFSYITADIAQWDPDISDWDASGYQKIAIANIYWPISPLIFDIQGPPLLMPKNTQSSDLTDFFDILSPIYDEIIHSSGQVILTNSTLERSLYYYFNETSGRLTMMYGWMKMPVPGFNWTYMSIYSKFTQPLVTGVNSFQLKSDFETDITITVELDTGSATLDYIYAFLPYNPTFESLPNGTALYFLDQLLTSYLGSTNISLTIKFPSSLDLKNLELFFYAFNISGTEEWDLPPPEFSDLIVYDYTENSITFTFPSWGTVSMISAISYIDHGSSEPFIIPGFNLVIFTLLLSIMFAFLIKKHRNMKLL